MIAATLLLAALLCAAQETTQAPVPQPAAGSPADLPRYLEVTPLIATGAQPTEAGVRKLAEQGFRAIINIRTAEEEGADVDRYRKLAEGLGLKYYHVPLVGKDPKEEQVTRFLETMEQLQNEKVFVHCAAANRVGAVMMCKRVLKDGLSTAEAEEEAKRIGLRTETLRKFALDYIEKNRK